MLSSESACFSEVNACRRGTAKSFDCFMFPYGSFPK